MSEPSQAAEKQFLLSMAITAFNDQYRRNIQPGSCTIRSIENNYRCAYGYEIHSIRDYLRLRMYFNLGDLDFFQPYRLEVDTTFVPGQLGDEVYVMLGTLQRAYKESGQYRFRPLLPDDADYAYVEFVKGGVVEFINGGKMQYVG